MTEVLVFMVFWLLIGIGAVGLAFLLVGMYYRFTGRDQ